MDEELIYDDNANLEPYDEDIPPEVDLAEEGDQDPDEGPVEGGSDTEEVQEVDGNPNARLRIMQRDKEILEQRLREMQGVVETLSRRGVTPEGDSEEEDEEEFPLDPDDPLTPVTQEVRELRKQREKDEKQRELDRINGEISSLRAAAYQEMQAVQNEDPDAYSSAMEHLSNSLLEEARQDHPNLTDREIGQQVMQEIARRQIRYVRSGTNAGKAFLNLAKARGWKGNSSDKAAPKKKKGDDNVEEVRRQRARQGKSGSIGTVGVGNGPKGDISTRQVAKMSEEEYAAWAREKGLSMMDILKDKARA